MIWQETGGSYIAPSQNYLNKHAYKTMRYKFEILTQRIQHIFLHLKCRKTSNSHLVTVAAFLLGKTVIEIIFLLNVSMAP